MRNKVILAALVVLLHADTGHAQTASEIEAKFGKPENVYSASERIWMTPTYAADGQLCLMRLYPKRVAPGNNYLDDVLSVDETLSVINELIPPHTRGKRQDTFGMTTLGGGVAWTRFNYSLVTLTFVTSVRLDKVPDRLTDFGADEFLLPDFDEKALAEARRREALRPDDELIRERTAKPRVLEIRWTNRNCSGP